MCEISLDDPAEVWCVTWRKARKPHRCDTCSAPIAPGARYQRVAWVHDRTAYAEKSCASCAWVAEEYRKEHGVVWHPSQMWYAVDDCARKREPGWRRWQGFAQAMEMRRRKAAEQEVHRG